MWTFNWWPRAKMSTQSDSLEIVHEGWLTKSPPSKSIWGARWRKRWFVLRHSGELPDQYFLCYYTDKNCRKMKGRIDLDQCEQVDAGLKFENRKQKYQHMFDVKTPKRTYYLAAETEMEMNKWVDCVCHVCGLKVYSSDDTAPSEDFPNGDDETNSATEDTPPVSPTSTASGPYIPISECISGKPLSSPDGLSHLLALQQQQSQGHRTDTYDAPRRLLPTQLELRNCTSNTPPLQSPATDGDSVFSDEEYTKPPVNWQTFPRPSDSSADGDAPPPSSTVTVSKRFTRNLDQNISQTAPPRPPKPLHLVASENVHNYSNLEDITAEGDEKTSGLSDEMYDFPRSHTLIDENDCPAPRPWHSYSNAAPGKVNGEFFRYDLDSTQQLTSQEEANSPHGSESPSVYQYTNLPSPAGPPVVNRGLKPGRRDSSASNEPSPVAYAPSVDRKLKPSTSIRGKLESHDDGAQNNILKLCNPPLRRQTNGSQSLRKSRAAPSPDRNTTYRRHSNIFDEEPFSGLEDKIQYLDLALNSSNSSKYLGPVTPSSVYKAVDFLKTGAFNRTREIVEQERKGRPVY